MRNTLGDLNNHLFEQLERLNDEDLKGSQLLDEIERAKAITIISNQIIQAGNLSFKVAMAKHDNYELDTMPKSLEG